MSIPSLRARRRPAVDRRWGDPLPHLLARGRRQLLRLVLGTMAEPALQGRAASTERPVRCAAGGSVGMPSGCAGLISTALDRNETARGGLDILSLDLSPTGASAPQFARKRCADEACTIPDMFIYAAPLPASAFLANQTPARASPERSYVAVVHPRRAGRLGSTRASRRRWRGAEPMDRRLCDHERRAP